MAPKRHHYLPRFYLDRFCRDGIVWVYDRSENTFRGQQPVNTAVLKDYYAFKTEEGGKSLEVEELLSQIEGDAKPVLDKIDRREVLSEEDRGHLALFIGFLAARVPDFEKTFGELVDHVVKLVTRQSFATPDRTDALLGRFERERPGSEPIDRQRMREFIQSNDYKVEPHRNYVIATMLQIAMEQARLIAQMDWSVLVPPKKKTFVLSDAPLSILAPSKPSAPWMGVGLITPGAKKVLPLGSEACLVMGDHGSAFDYTTVTDGIVRHINLTTTARCDRFVIARDERQLRSLVRATRIAGTQRASKIAFA